MPHSQTEDEYFESLGYDEEYQSDLEAQAAEYDAAMDEQRYLEEGDN